MFLSKIRSLLLLLALGISPLALAGDARQTVETLHAALLEAMRDGASLGFAGRTELLTPVLAQSFDFRTISRLVTGRYWAEMADAQKDEFVKVFSALSAATYADNFDEFGGERFETRAAVQKKTAEVVKTVIIDAEGEETSLNYLLAPVDGEWRIVNVIADGVSDISLKRAEYSGVIAAEGIEALVAKLKAKTASYEQRGS